MKSQNRTLSILAAALTAAVVSLATPAFAQEAGTPPGSAPAAPKNSGSTVANVPGLGVGATIFLSGLGGPDVVYDFGAWHLEGMLAFDHRPANGGPNPPSSTTFEFGAGGWYHLHLGESSDFSLGGSLGFLTNSTGPASNTAMVFEPGAMVRVFVTPNVAIHARLGLIFAVGDNVGPLQKQIGLDGEVANDFGFTYFFR
jgi:hypothetical protein